MIPELPFEPWSSSVKFYQIWRTTVARMHECEAACATLAQIAMKAQAMHVMHQAIDKVEFYGGKPHE